jgi:hypothetical protein
MSMISPRVLIAFAAVASLSADQKKLTMDQRVEIMRGLVAEYATVKVPLPCSPKPLDLDTHGAWSQSKWDAAAKQFGPAGRIGDLVQITSVDIGKDSITLVINNGMRRKGGWKDHVQIGMSGPVGTSSNTTNPNQTNAPNGTILAIRFDDGIGDVSSSDVKKMLAPVLDFDKHSATEQYTETLSPEVKQAISEKKPIEGMTRDEVLLALGRPVHKSRESKDGVDYEDWIYGNPPGRVTFVTFVGPKVVKVKDTYAGLGGTIAETPAQP